MLLGNSYNFDQLNICYCWGIQLLQEMRILLVLVITSISLWGCGQEKAVMKQFADKLYAKEICSKADYDKLLSDLGNNRINNGIDFLKYCNKAIIVNLGDYSDKPEIYLEQIHKATSTLVSGLEFADFSFRIVLDSSYSDFKSYDVIVSFRSNGRTYTHKSFINPEDIGVHKNMEYFGKISQQEYYKIFNKVLADLESPYRLHEVKGYKGNAVDWNKFGIIALTKDQAAMLHGGGVYFTPSYETFRNTLTSQKIDSAIEMYKAIGLFKHLTKEQIDASCINAVQRNNQSLNDVLSCFPSIIYNFDTELANLENPYEELLNEFSLISKQQFNPTNIIDNFSKPVSNSVLVEFSINGKRYSNRLLLDNDWVDPAFFDIAQKAVSENVIDGQFYNLYSDGQDANVIFLSKKQEEFLRTNKLIVFADQWQEMDE